MRCLSLLAALMGIAAAQSTASTLTGPPMGVYKTANNQPAITATTLTEVAAEATGVSKRNIVIHGDGHVVKRHAGNKAALAKRDDVCVAQPSGIPYATSPDDPNSFVKDSYYTNAATTAKTPTEYSVVFTNLVAANSADNYLGFTFMDSYDVAKCAYQCTGMTNCVAFNVYFERDPTLWPDATSCPNPPSLSRIKCVWWGAPVSLDNARNYGQKLASFDVVVAGSNGYENTARASAYKSAQATKTAGGAVATATATTNSVWIVYYSADSTTGAFGNGQASASFNDCMTICDNTANCGAFTYVGGNDGVGAGTCWLKTGLGNPTTSGQNFVSCVRVVNSGNAPSLTTTTTLATSIVASTSDIGTSLASSSTSSRTDAGTTVVTSSTTAYELYRPIYGTQTTAAVISTVGYSAEPTTAAQTTLSSSTTTTSTTTSVTTTTTSTTTTTTTTSTTTTTTTTSTTTSTTTTTTTTTPAPTTTTTTTTTFDVPTTLATRLAVAVKPTTTSTTTTAAATPTGAFYIQVGWGQQATNQYAYVNWWAGGAVQFTDNKYYATQFRIDSGGYLRNQNWMWLLNNYVGLTRRTGGDWQRYSFKPSGWYMDPTKCRLQDGYVMCDNSVGFAFAGTCDWDPGYLFFGAPSRMPRGCGWIGLYPVAA
ncbi:Hypothetical protein D9617_2g055980 [Elsinoe fawcettii]|nr:Hypothetical protein D9617_2g055980 [Elsinoe fawcettii]